MRLGKTLLALALAGGLLLTQGVGAAASEPAGFSNVDEADWYAGAVAYVRENGLMSGVSDTAFAPGAAMTRGMLATALWRYAGSPEAGAEGDFADEADLSPWAGRAADWAAARGLVGLRDGNRFDPGGIVSRGEAAAALAAGADVL